MAAQKRMFDRAIIDTDRFMDLSMSSKALYFLLGMEADDEGFVSYKKVMRVHGGNEDDMKILVAKGFILLFESGVVVITDWNTNNYLDKNRIRQTEYQKEKKQILLTDGKKYVFNNGLTSIEESSIEESSIEEKRIDIAPTSGAEVFSLKDEIKKLEDSTRRDLNIIALYLEKRNPDIRTKAQLSIAIKRHLRPAKDLSAFEDSQIIKGFELAKKSTADWVLETAVKMLTK